MAFDVSALAAYSKDNEKSLVVKSLFDAKTQSLILAKGNVMSGVKTSEQINILDTDVVFQAGGTCGFSSSGTTTFTRRAVTVGKIKVNESLCPKALEAKYTQLLLKAGSRPDSVPNEIEKEYTDLKAGVTAQQLETGIWQGDTNSGTANLNKFDGLVKIIDAVKTVPVANVFTGSGTATSTTGAAAFVGVGSFFTTEVAVNDKLYTSAGVLIGTVLTVTDDTNIVLAANGAVAITGAAYQVFPKLAQTAAGATSPILTATGITEANVRGIVKSMWKAIPAKVKGKDDVVIFCGWDVYESYIGALIEANLFSYTAGNEAQKAGELTIPGTQYKLTAVHGLDSQFRLYALRMSNMYFGCDIEGEEDKWEIFFAKEADEIRYVNEFKAGVNVAFPNEIVSFKLA